jgi:hypothetical protein
MAKTARKRFISRTMKMRRLSKFLLIILTAVLFLPACGSGIRVERKILGTWESKGSLFEPSRTAVFTHDKVLILTNYFGEEERMHYAIIAPGKMRINDGESEQIISFRLKGDLLELELDEGLLSLERVAPEVSAYATPTTVSARKEGPISPPETTADQAPGNSPGGQQPAHPTAAAIGPFITPTPREYYPLKNCASSQLHVGDTAFISWDTTPNALRTTPDTHPSNNFVDDGRVPPGGILEILDGPVCNYGWVLWYVRTTWDVEGWTPETDGKEYWMLPIATRHICKDSKPTRLIAGKKAFVEEEPNDPVEVYRVMEATINDPSSILYRIPIKEVVDLLEGPFCDGKGANWWLIRTKTNIEGYIRENDKYKDYYFMAPVP